MLCISDLGINLQYKRLYTYICLPIQILMGIVGKDFA